MSGENLDRYGTTADLSGDDLPAPDPKNEPAKPAPPDGEASPDDTSSDVVRTQDGHGKRAEAGEWIGRRIGKYHITGLLGVGGMGLVYEARDTSLDRDVAIKILPAELSTEERTRGRFLAEAKAAARLSHPNVVQIHEINEFESTFYIVMELVRGGNAGEHVERDGPYSVEEATRIVCEACGGMQAAHAAGLVHRDVKPANLMLTPEGTVKIGDFGLAKGAVNTSVDLTREGTALGTPAFMSPEQCEAKPADARSDVYALGGTYYKLLVGRDPYADAGDALRTMYAHCRTPPPDPRAVDPTLPESVAAVVMKAMAKKPRDRYQSADEMRADLERIQQAESVTVVGLNAISHAELDTTVLDRPSTRTKTRRYVIGGLAGAAIALVIGLGAAGWLPGIGGAERDENEPKTGDGAVALDQGVTADTITLGTSTSYSGASRDLGVNIVQGLQAAFREANAAGGVHGRKIDLVVLDDGYEPTRALENVRQLVEDRHVFAVVGNVGTPTAEVTAPFCIGARRLFFAPFTGARFLREDPPDRYVFNVRAGYADETAALVRYFVETEKIPPDEIAVFAQNDSFGDDGFHGVVRALAEYDVAADDVLRVGYERNSIRVDEAVAEIAANRDRVSAIIMVSTYGATARFIRGIRDAGVNAELAGVSFVGSELLAERLREIGPEYGEGVIVTRVVPDPRSNSTGVLRYRDALEKYVPEASPGSVSLEGYIAGRVLLDGLQRAGRDLDTESLIDALEGIRDLDLGIGPLIAFGPSRHQASHRVWATRLDGEGRYHALDLESR